MRKKYKNVYVALNYIKHLLILVSAIIGSVLNSPFASLVSIPTGITSTLVKLKIYFIIPVFKKYN